MDLQKYIETLSKKELPKTVNPQEGSRRPRFLLPHSTN